VAVVVVVVVVVVVAGGVQAASARSVAIQTYGFMVASQSSSSSPSSSSRNKPAKESRVPGEPNEFDAGNPLHSLKQRRIAERARFA
jgi:hypothetical protein